jgi:CBS domain-containing protein
MEPPPPPIPADLSLSEALDRYLRGHEGEAFPVVDDGRVIGMLTFGSARDVGMVEPLRPVRDAVIPLSQVLTVDVSEPLEEAVVRLGAGRSALVLDDGRLVGAITGGTVARWVAGRRSF